MAPKTLTPAQERLILAIADLGIVTTEQLCVYFSSSDLSTFSAVARKVELDKMRNRCRRIEHAGFLSSTSMQVFDEDNRPQKNLMHCFFVSKKNIAAIQKTLSAQGRADDFFKYEDTAHNLRDASTFAFNTLRHETGITQVHTEIQRACRDRSVDLSFFLRTSPQHKAISEKITVTLTSKKTGKQITKSLPFNPDAVFGLRDQKGLTFYCLEYDNNTETATEKITNKLLAYESYRVQNLFTPRVRDYFNPTYDLGLTVPETVGFRVLFVTRNDRRRNDLFAKSLLLPGSSFFLFASLSDLATSGLACWLGKKHFAPYSKQFSALSDARPSVRRRFRDESIHAMEKITIP